MLNAEDVIKNVAQQGKAQQKKVEELVQLVIFELDKEEYAVEIKDLQEIIKIPEITPVPNAPDFIPGIFNLRGRIVVVVDLEKRFNLKRENETKESNIIIAEVEGNSYGVVVDNVKEIKNIPKSIIQATPKLATAKIHDDYLKGVVVIESQEGEEENGSDSRLIILLDLSKMLLEKELMNLGKTVNEIVANENKLSETKS